MRLTIVAMAVTAMAVCSKKNGYAVSSYLNAIPEDAMLVQYVDGYGILQKSGLLQDFAPLRDVGAAQVAGMLEEEDASYVKGIMGDFDRMGIATSKPMYAAVTMLSEEEVSVVLLAEVLDRAEVDRLVEFVRKNGVEIATENVDDCTLMVVERDEEFMVGYNESTLAIVSGEGIDIRANLLDVLKSARTPRKTALPDFSGKDMATYLDLDECIALASRIDESDEDMAELYARMLDEEASLVLGLTFETGRIAVTAAVEGIKEEFLAKYENTGVVSNEYLKYLPRDVYAVMGSNMNGKLVFDSIMEMPEIKKNIDQIKQYVGEQMWDMGMEIAKNGFYSLNGDFMAALTSVSQNPEQVDVKVAAFSTVDNDYILSTLMTYLPAGMYTQLGDKQYLADVDGMSIWFGQQDRMLYASNISAPAVMPVSAQSAAWTADVEGARSYMAVNLRALFGDPYVAAQMQREVYSDRQAGAMAREIVGLLDYAFARDRSMTSGDLDIIFVNRDVNSLKQIVDVAKPALMGNLGGLFL